MFNKLLIANRGEIAVRLVRAAQDMGITAVAVYARDDAGARHVALADAAVALDGEGPAAYLDGAALIAAAQAQACDALHPGYGFLSERADFASDCAAAELVFIGPSPEQLALFGDKAEARALAAAHGVPLMPGTGNATLEEALAFFDAQRAADPQAGIVIKAVAGGGGRGMRMVLDRARLPEAYARCRAEALAAFGVPDVYAERLIPRARHLEVQVVGDGQRVMALGERECTLQRRFQKLVEAAPSPGLARGLRDSLVQHALTLTEACALRSLCTVEFLLDEGNAARPLVFIEANPRLQVEHTVTEAVTGLDLVALQIGIAAGRSLAQLGLDPHRPPQPRGHAVQWRIHSEAAPAVSSPDTASGRVTRCEFAQGPGIRVDTALRVGLVPSPHHDSLQAKLIVHQPSGDWGDVLRRSRRALAECHIEGLATNLPLLRLLAAHDALQHPHIHTRWLEQAWPELQAALLLQAMTQARPATAAANAAAGTGEQGRLLTEPGHAAATTAATPADATTPATEPEPPPGWTVLRAPMAGRVLGFSAAPDAVLAAGAEAVVLEAMKMHHGIALPQAGRLAERRVAEGQMVQQSQALAWVAPADGQAALAHRTAVADPEAIRPDLQRLRARSALTHDAARPEAVAKRHAQGGRTARENIAALCDPGSFIEYGALAIAAQTRRRSVDDLQRHTPADGLVTGIGSVNAAVHGAEAARCAVLAYDYTVLAGTQGFRNHHKKDRLLSVIHDWRLPTVLFAEGGGGRPGDVDMPIIAGLNNHTFSRFAALSGQVPVLGVVHGHCFAGNAALVGCADTLIATRSAHIGMGGPAMVEGGGLGVFRPEDIGPAAEGAACGVVDLLVDDEAAASVAARRWLGYFQGPLADWQAADARLLRHAAPEDRLRAYDMKALIHALFDSDSVMLLREGFGHGMCTALARLGGQPLGVLANNPQHLGGAIDPDGADKASRFMQLCEARGLPLVSLCDTPGFMVGPEVERRAQVRHACRMFVAAAHLSVPCFTVVVRKGYGLGAQAMAVGGFDAPVFTIAWPTAEFGGMGLEGAVRLGFRKELEAQPAGPARDALYRQLVAQQYERGSALNMAETLEIDAVIDPADTRDWLRRGLQAVAAGGPRAARKPRLAGRFIDPW